MFAVKGYYDQSNAYKNKAFNWGLDYSFRVLALNHRGWEHYIIKAATKVVSENFTS